MTPFANENAAFFAEVDDLWRRHSYDKHPKIIYMGPSNEAFPAYEQIENALNQIPPFGFLRYHPLNTISADEVTRIQQGLDYRPAEDPNSRRLDIGEHPHYGGEGDELAWKHFQKAIKVATHPLDQPSQYMDSNLDPPRMRAAMGPVWKGLKPFQQDGIGVIVAAEKDERGAANGVLLADSMGMGKTVQVIAALRPIKHTEPICLCCQDLCSIIGLKSLPSS